jgi:hypothetical protein
MAKSDKGLLRPSAYDFDMASHVHGLDHTLRVMYLVRHLAALLGVGRQVGLTAYCASVIHDMARTHDGYCEMHGEWAVERKLPGWREKFLGIGLEEAQLDAVAFAVRWHCADQRIVPPSPHLPCLQLLQDADALDRVRFGGQNAIRTEYLHFPVTVSQMDHAERLFHGWSPQ